MPRGPKGDPLRFVPELLPELAESELPEGVRSIVIQHPDVLHLFQVRSVPVESVPSVALALVQPSE